MLKRMLSLLSVLLVLEACEDVDCTLNNVVLCRYRFYSSETQQPIALGDTLSVTAFGTDSVLFNRGLNVKQLSLPLSYWQATDTLVVRISTPDDTYESLLYVSKQSTPHFESPDCPTTMFHQLSSARATGAVIDSVAIVRRDVNYLQDENIRIFVRTGAQ